MRFACVLLLLVAATAHADKPTIAILGVSPKFETSLTKTAAALDRAIRSAATAKYKVAGSAKQIADALRTAECSAFETACAATLGDKLGTEFTIAGELEKRGGSIELQLAIVDVASKKKIRSYREKVGGNADMKKVAKRAIDRLTGVGQRGELVVVANVQRGEIYIDDELRGELFEGRSTITLPQGRYKLRIRAANRKPFEDIVTVDETTQLNVLLD